MKAINTTLGGTLERREDGWYWKDGTKEPRVRDMRLRDLAPNFRCINRGGKTMVEVPHDWTNERHWPNRQIDKDVLAGMRELLQHRSAEAGEVFAEGLAELLDDHRLSKPGWLVPIEAWDAVMNEHCGCWWDMREQDDILARAKTLGYTP